MESSFSPIKNASIAEPLPSHDNDEAAAAVVDTMVVAAPLPMFGALIVLRVKDYPAWKALFDSRLSERKAAGCVAQGMMHGVDNRRVVAVWLAVVDAHNAKAYFSQRSWREAMKSAAVIGRPEVYLWSNASARSDPDKQGLDAVMLTARVKDFDAFEAGFAAGAPLREQAGIVGYSLGRDIDDPHVAYVYLQSEDLDALRQFVGARSSRQRWREAGVRGAPTALFLKEGELTPYK